MNTQYGTLYIVATPLGNLEDISKRALRILEEVSIVFAEDTRETKKLLSHFSISTPLSRYDEHSHASQSKKVLENLEEGKDVALVSDAGTPGISDPGSRLVAFLREHNRDVHIVPIPGPSAITALLSASGLPLHSFCFRGFVPHKKGRETFFNEVSESTDTVIFYESPHRILKTLNSLHERLGKDRHVIVGRELTKIHEEIRVGSAEEIYVYYKEREDKVRGEFTVAVEGRN